jgi:hypothetical protein
MTPFERFVLYFAVVAALVVGGYSYYKVTQIRAWANLVEDWTSHVHAEHFKEAHDHIPPPPPPPDW